MSPTMDEELGAPPPLEEMAPPPPKKSAAAGPIPVKGKTGVTHESVNYTSAAERCETCEYFDEDALQCKKHKFDAEPEGHCDSFELLGEGAGTDEMGEGEEPEPELGMEEEDEEEVY
jgi:hypothetical protein